MSLYEKWHKFSDTGGLSTAGCQILADWKRERDQLKAQLQQAEEREKSLTDALEMVGMTVVAYEYPAKDRLEWIDKQVEKALAAYDKAGEGDADAGTRKCPDCGERWHSSDESGTWTCEFCGAKIPPPGPGVCRVCGCTDEYGCPEGCWWVEPDLCSSCAGKDESK